MPIPIFDNQNSGDFTMSSNANTIVVQKIAANAVGNLTDSINSLLSAIENSDTADGIAISNTKLDELKSVMSGMATTMSNIGTTDAQIVSAVNAVKASLDTVATYVDGLESNTGATTTAVNSAKTAIDVVKTAIDSLNSTVVGGNTKLDTLHSDNALLATSAKQDTANTKLDTIATNQAAQATAANQVIVQNKLDSLAAKLDALANYGNAADMAATVNGTGYLAMSSTLISLGLGNSARYIVRNTSGSKAMRIIAIDGDSSVALQAATLVIVPSNGPSIGSGTVVPILKRNTNSGTASVADIRYDTNATPLAGTVMGQFYIGRGIKQNIVIPAGSSLGINIAAGLALTTTLSFCWYEV